MLIFFITFGPFAFGHIKPRILIGLACLIYFRRKSRLNSKFLLPPCGLLLSSTFFPVAFVEVDHFLCVYLVFAVVRSNGSNDIKNYGR